MTRLRTLVLPMLLPAFLVHASFSLLRAPGTWLGDRLEGGSPGAWATVNHVQAILSLALWSMPLAAILLSLPFLGSTWNLFMHELGAVLFLGNIIVSAVWMALARREGTSDALRLGIRGVLLTDALFTTPGVMLLLVNGGILATPYFRAGAEWVMIGATLFILTAVLYFAAIAPVQRRLSKLMEATPRGAPLPEAATPLVARWFRWGGIATLLPLIILVLMVMKPVF